MNNYDFDRNNPYNGPQQNQRYNSYMSNPYQPDYRSMQQPLYRPYVEDPYRQMNMNRPPQQSTGFYQNGSVFGRFIDVIDEVQPNEVPMDGSVTIFPQKDLSCIYAKQWSNDGTISTYRFDRVDNAPKRSAENTQDGMYSAIMARLDKIERMIGKRKRPMDKPNRMNFENKENETNATAD